MNSRSHGVPVCAWARSTTKEAADRMKERIDAGGMESTLVRVQR
ncbi:hypothetical protein [Candidatus Skiveiella danica]